MNAENEPKRWTPDRVGGALSAAAYLIIFGGLIGWRITDPSDRVLLALVFVPASIAWVILMSLFNIVPAAWKVVTNGSPTLVDLQSAVSTFRNMAARFLIGFIDLADLIRTALAFAAAAGRFMVVTFTGGRYRLEYSFGRTETLAGIRRRRREGRRDRLIRWASLENDD